MTGFSVGEKGVMERAEFRYSDLALIATMCLVLYLVGNDQVSLWDRDEAWYAQTAREMVDRGDYVVPTFNDQPRFRKPVLIYWLIAAAYAVFGDNEFGARFFSGVAGTVTCLLTYRLGVRMGGRKVGLAAAMMLAVAPFMVVESKLATTDAVLTATLVGAMSCVWELHVAGFSWRRSLAFWFLTGVAVMIKGPFGPAFLATAIGAWLLLCRERSVLGRMNWLAGIGLATAVCLPWGIAIWLATDGEFYRVAIGEQALGHSLSAMNDHRGFPGYYVVLALGGLMPWSFLFPQAFAGARRCAWDAGPGGFLLGWIFGPMIMLEVMRTKLPQYYLPAFPACAILIARGTIAFNAAGNRLAQSAAGRRRVSAISALTLIVTLVMGILAAANGPTDLLAPAIVAAGTLAAGSLAALVLALQQRDGSCWRATVGSCWLVGLVVSAWLLPNVESCRVARLSAKALREHAGRNSHVILFGYREPSLVFYLGRPVPTFSVAGSLAKHLGEHGPALTLLRDSDVTRLKKDSRIEIQPVQRVESKAATRLAPTSVLVARVSLSSEPVSSAMHYGRTTEKN